MVNDYDAFVSDTWMGSTDNMGLAIATLGLVGEAGEVSEKIKKKLRGDSIPDNFPGQIVKELGDVLYYLTWIANYYGCSLEGVKQENVEKLSSRFARGTQRGNGDNR